VVKTKKKKEPKETNSAKDKRLHKDILTEIQADETAKESFEATWWECFYFYIGQQWLRYIRSSSNINMPEPVNISSKSILPVTNHIREICEVLRGKFLKRPSIPGVSSINRSIENRRGAEGADHLVKYRYRIDKDQSRRVERDTMLQMYGNAFIKLVWNKDLGEEYPVPTEWEEIDDLQQLTVMVCQYCGEIGEDSYDKCPMCGGTDIYPRTTEKKNKKRIPSKSEWKKRGDIEIELRSPFNIIPYRYAKNWEGLVHLTDRSVRHTSWVKQHFPDITISEDELESVDSIDEDADVAMLGGDVSNPPAVAASGMVRIYEHYKRPCKEYPNGLVVLLTKGQILYKKERMPYFDNLPKKYMDYPYIHFKYSIVPGMFWAQGAVEPLIPIQKQFNQLDRHIIIWTKKSIGSKIIVTNDCGLLQKDISGSEGEIWNFDYKPNQPAPQIIPGVDLPIGVWKRREDLKLDMYRVSGAEQIIRGETGAGEESGIAIGIKQENAQDRLLPILEGIDEQDIQYHRRKLMYLQQFADYDQQIDIIGKDGKPEVVSFNSKDIGNNFNVFMDTGTGGVRSHTIDMQFALDLMDREVIDRVDPKMRTEIVKKAGLPQFTPDYSDDEKKAERIIDRLKGGDYNVSRYEPINQFDDDETVYRVLRSWIISPSFEELVKDNPELLEHANRVCGEYYEQVQNALANRMQMEQGAPPGGQASPPPQVEAMRGGMPSPQSAPPVVSI